MSQTLRVNEKEYVPSSDLAGRFNYTSDYISKLARDEKVLGTRVGRQWFVETESLRTHIQQLEVEKKINQENLSRQRKLERKVSGKQAPPVVPDSEHSHVVAAAQALVVTLCGLLVGFISLTAQTYDLQVSQMAGGAQVVVEQVSQEIFAGLAFLLEYDSLESKSVTANISATAKEIAVADRLGVGPQFQTVGVYTTLPILSRFAASTTELYIAEAYADESRLPFSDMVLIDSVNGEILVQPFFRDSMGDLYHLSITPASTTLPR